MLSKLTTFAPKKKTNTGKLVKKSYRLKQVSAPLP